MLLSAFMIFFIAAIFDLIVLSAALNDKPISKIYLYWQGPIALVGILVLSTAIYYGDRNSIILTDLFIFMFSILIGFVVCAMDFFKKYLPKRLVIIQVITIVFALVLLVYYLLYHKKDSTSIYAEENNSSLVFAS